MQRLSLNVEMEDFNATSAILDRTYDTFTDDELRSPRTPTYAPTSPSSSEVIAFDVSRILASSIATFQQTSAINALPAEPVKPLAWIWECHLCQSRYPLSATRRCLHDGHFYCSGETARPNLKKKTRGQSCSSEFDYSGWREWAEWKRNVFGNLEDSVETQPCAKNCRRCEYPSHCRYASSRTTPVSNAVGKKKSEWQLLSSSAENSNPPRSPNLADRSRFYLADKVPVDSILTSATTRQNKQSQLMMKNYSTEAEAGTDSSSTMSIRPTSTSLERVFKPVKKSIKDHTLSPIAEVVSTEVDSTAGLIDNTALQSWDDILGSPNEVEDQMGPHIG